MNNPGIPIESPNKANTRQNPTDWDQYGLISFESPRGLQLSWPCPRNETREGPHPLAVSPSGVYSHLQNRSQFHHQACPHHDAQVLHAQENPHMPQRYRNPLVGTPPSQPNPNPRQNNPQSFHSNVGDVAQEPIVESQLVQGVHHIPRPMTSTGPMDRAEGGENPGDSSEVQFVCETRRAGRMEGNQGYASKGSITPHIENYPSEKGISSDAQSKHERSQPSADPTTQPTAKSKLAKYLSSTQIESLLTYIPHRSSTEKNKAALKPKARKISKRHKRTAKSSKKTQIPTDGGTAGQKKRTKEDIHRKKGALLSRPPTRYPDCGSTRQMSHSKEPNAINATLSQASPSSYPNNLMADANRSTSVYREEGRKDLPKCTRNVVMEGSSKNAEILPLLPGNSTDGNLLYNPSRNSYAMKTRLGSKRCFDDTTRSETPYAGQEMPEITPSRQGQKRSRQDGFVKLNQKNAPMKTVRHQQRKKHKKDLTSSNPTICGSQNSFNVEPGFPRETELAANVEILPGNVAIPEIPRVWQQLPSIPEPPCKDETDDEHDQNELESRFGEIKEGYIWHSRSGWVMHPSYFEQKIFKLCVMHRACKHKVDCQTTRFQMAIISCAKNKLTPRELQYLWGTSRIGVAKWASNFKGMPVKYLLVPVKRIIRSDTLSFSDEK